MKKLARVLGDRTVQFTVLLFLTLTAWRLLLLAFPSLVSDDEHNLLFWWGALYQLVALWGACWGLAISRYWGGLKSVMGRAIVAFSLGLFFQSFGQAVYSVLIFQGLEIPYPSIGDIGFFGSIPLYIIGIIMLARASGAAVSLRSYMNKLQAIVIPIIMLAFSYYFFLTGYEFDWSAPLVIFLDFGYPLGQAIYVSIAVLTYLLSRNMLGGIMRMPTLFFLAALIIQYLSDYTFLYQASREIYAGGGTADYMYLVSYTVMAISLIQLRMVYKNIRQGGKIA